MELKNGDWVRVAGIERLCLVQAEPRVLVIDPRGEGIHVELSRIEEVVVKEDAE